MYFFQICAPPKHCQLMRCQKTVLSFPFPVNKRTLFKTLLLRSWQQEPMPRQVIRHWHGKPLNLSFLPKVPVVSYQGIDLQMILPTITISIIPIFPVTSFFKISQTTCTHLHQYILRVESRHCHFTPRLFWTFSFYPIKLKWIFCILNETMIYCFNNTM